LHRILFNAVAKFLPGFTSGMGFGKSSAVYYVKYQFDFFIKILASGLTFSHVGL
jgi:hypothetical protein